MADGLKREQIVILRIDGEDLHEFLQGPCFESDMLSIFSEIELSNGSYSDHIIKALEKLSVDQGMPPAYDSWVRSNIIDVALQSCASFLEQPVSKETILIHFKKVGETIAKLLKEQPVIVAHCENTFDGNAIKKLLSDKFELDKILSSALQSVPRDPNGTMTYEYLCAVLDFIAPATGLPLNGAVHQMDKVTNEAIKVLNVCELKIVEEEDLKKLLLEVLGNMMLQLEGNLITFNTNSVVHEPFAASSDMMISEEEGEIKWNL